MYLLALLIACSQEQPSKQEKPASQPITQSVAQAPAGPDAKDVQKKAQALFQPLPTEVTAATNPLTDAKIALGRALYYDTRLSKNHDVSCNSCHDLANYGVDGKPTSSGHKAQLGGRNSPTTYNAALHFAQFWDGRAPDVEAQAKGPVTNPVEMAMPDEASVNKVLKSIPGYEPMFKAAFPDDKDPVNFNNAALAIAAFERRLVTPGPFDKFLAGDVAALSPEQVKGLNTFMEVGCTTCHSGAAVGGGMYQKIGLAKPYETKDEGRSAVTKNEAEKFFFKVPSLRNIEKTAPYFHDGGVATLDDAVRLMAEHQLGRTLTPDQAREIRVFLGSLTGTIDATYITKPELPPSGPKTPKPDPS